MKTVMCILLSYVLQGLVTTADSHIIYDTNYTLNLEFEKFTPEEIPMTGTLTTNIPRAYSVTENTFKPIQVFYLRSENILNFKILSTLGNLDIVVHDEMGNSFHHGNVDAIAGGQYTINTSAWLSGTYFIYITNSIGECLYGSVSL